jgi:hypothetical protein
MIWFYERLGGALRIETRIDPMTKEYVLQMEWPGRPTMTERFPDHVAFEARLLAIERQLKAEHWKQVSGPAILPHGWLGDPQPHGRTAALCKDRRWRPPMPLRNV